MTNQSYVAQLVFRILYSGQKDEQYEEQWRLIFAKDERSALDQAKQIGNSDEAVFADRQGRIIQWQLVAVKDLFSVNLSNGALLASVVKEVTPVAEPLWEL